MPGKGGAARPNPVQRPVAGMGGKGVGQPPAQQPNLNNALSGLAGAPVQTYPFPQPPAQQPTAGMGGKGVGQQPVLSQPQLDIINSGGTVGMGGKGVGGQLPPQAGTLNEALMGLNQPPVQVQPAPAAGMGGKGVGQTRNPELEALAAYKAIAPEQRGELVQPAPVQQAPITGIRTAYNAATGQNLQPIPPRPVQPATGMSGKGALRSAAKTPQPVRAEQQKVATQRLLQQLASRNRGRGRR